MRLINALPMDGGLALRDVVDFDGEVAIDVDLFVVAVEESNRSSNKNLLKSLFRGSQSREFWSSSSASLSIFRPLFESPVSLVAQA